LAVAAFFKYDHPLDTGIAAIPPFGLVNPGEL